ncbi:hypothetical protein KBC75_01595 [Candidatus Shapirobacteria bacterium]|nr:hypothetical protein [Candidatus Shapirobacteria bacterium]
MNKKLFFVLFLLLTSYFLNLNAPPARAQHFTSTNYIIDWGNFNITSGSKTSTSFNLTDTVGQNAPGANTSTSYTLKSGFQYIYDTFNQFSFQISSLSIPLGTLVPGVGTSATNTLTITTPSGHGYEIYALENHPLALLSSGTTIPDTKCDSNTCSETSSGVWTSSSAYGFGFNTLGTNSSGAITHVGTSGIFTDSTYYRQFANILAGETPQVIMTENSPVKNRTAQVTYKSLISGIQSAGVYQNAITFIAIPKY